MAEATDLDRYIAEATTASTSSDSDFDAGEKEQDLAVRKVRLFTRHRLEIYKYNIRDPLRHASKRFQGRKRAPKIIETQYSRFRGWAKDANVYKFPPRAQQKRSTTIRWLTPKEDYRNLDPQKQKAVDQSLKDMDEVLKSMTELVREKRKSSRSRARQGWPLKLVEIPEFLVDFRELQSFIDRLERLVSLDEPGTQINTSAYTIKTVYVSCITAYTSALESISKPEDQQEHGLFDRLYRERDCLEKWARNAGVLEENEASFDHRLRGSPELQHQIIDILLQMVNTVAWIEAIKQQTAVFDDGLSFSESDSRSGPRSLNSSVQQDQTSRAETERKESLKLLNDNNCFLWYIWYSFRDNEEFEDEVPSKGWAHDENAAALLPPRRAAVVDLARDLTESCIWQYWQIVYHFDEPDGCFKIRELPPGSSWCRDNEALKEWAKKARLRGYHKDSPKRNNQEGLEYDFCNARFEDQLSIIEYLKHMQYRLIRLLEERQSNDGTQEDLHPNLSSTPKSWGTVCNFGREIKTLERLIQPSNTPSGLEGDACRTIETYHQTCLEAYAVAIDHLDRAEERTKQKLSSPEAIQHELRDLESWALDTGLLSQGKYSLEYRLMYTKGNKACEDVCQKLRKIEAMLQEMVPLITGERIPGEDQELSDSDTDSHSNSATELQQYVNSLASRNEDLKGVTDAYGLGSCTKPVSSPDDTPAYGQSRYTDPVTDEPVIMKGLEDLEIGTKEGTASI